MIAVNWGSTNFRAYRIDPQGTILAEIQSSRGALSLSSNEFYSALIDQVGEWITGGEKQILMCGMVGAAKGWTEAPYVPVPATLEQVVAHCMRIDIPHLDVRIVPGLSGFDEEGIPEVMRGEETEIFGSVHNLANFDSVCLPGTHSKWVHMQEEEILSFTTYMTGDLFQAIRSGTVLKNPSGSQFIDREDFLRGIDRSRKQGALAHHLFGVRTLVLRGALREDTMHSYLSGLLIGHEVRSAALPNQRVHLIGDSQLCSLYAVALEALGCLPSVEPRSSSVRGLIRIAQRLQWNSADC